MTQRTTKECTLYDVLSIITRDAREEGHTVNLVDYICATRGWGVMQTGDKVTIHFEDKRYAIVRLEDKT